MSFLLDLATKIKIWADNKFEPKLPSRTGNAGKVLSTNGTILSWIEAAGGSSTSFYSQTNLNINGTNGNFFIVPLNTNTTFVLSNIEVGIIYYIRIYNSNPSNTISITLPNTADIRPRATVLISANTYKTFSFIFDGTFREWQISETGATL